MRTGNRCGVTKVQRQVIVVANNRAAKRSILADQNRGPTQRNILFVCLTARGGDRAVQDDITLACQVAKIRKGAAAVYRCNVREIQSQIVSIAVQTAGERTACSR